ncbi:hypothetical protein Tsp_13685 [Trichinella spiralis]|uniref:hypothetical protein n=1 Tax=Trichinella spiralis TaxID=6334 RepID=UPI0001EFD462|nr:hypothetical protein Tsp_13685 [Trichinella spiralis]
MTRYSYEENFHSQSQITQNKSSTLLRYSIQPTFGRHGRRPSAWLIHVIPEVPDQPKYYKLVVFAKRYISYVQTVAYSVTAQIINRPEQLRSRISILISPFVQGICDARQHLWK